jgi:hypothetical protein
VFRDEECKITYSSRPIPGPACRRTRPWQSSQFGPGNELGENKECLEILERKEKCRLHRKSPKKYNNSCCWRIKVTCLCLAVGQTLLRTGFVRLSMTTTGYLTFEDPSIFFDIEGTVQRDWLGCKGYHSKDFLQRERRRDLQLVLTIPSHVRGPSNFTATSYKIWNVTS